ncbi:MAG: HPF/RaiA family ribosome-associated protein [Planctomycetota bacterium]|jgi:ribosomal subunit interface protein
MQLQINYGDIQNSESLSDHTEKHVNKSLGHLSNHVTRVEVHLHDDKQKRHGPDDKRCTMEARIANKQPLAVEARGEDIYSAVNRCAAKMARAVGRKIHR